MGTSTPKMIVHEVDPRPRLVRYEALPASGLLGRAPRRLAVGPLEVALLHRGGRVWLRAPAGSADELVTLADRGERVLMVPRELRALVSLEGCRFADGCTGTVSLWAHGAIVGTDRPTDHPLTRDPLAVASESGFLRRLRDTLWQGFGPDLLELVARIDPDARTRTIATARALRGFVRRDDVRAALRRDGLFAFTDELRVHAVEVPERDAVHRAALEASGRPLGLVATWRALDEHGTLNPRLSPLEALPTGTWLDVAVTATRDAWVYVLVKGSSGRWQCLVPDRDALVAIPRPNRQRAGRTVRWPGSSRRYPDKPYWRLDRRPGTERIVVVASLDRLDGRLDRLLNRRGIGAARAQLGPRTVRRDSAAPSYRQATECLVGDGAVMQELVVEHRASLSRTGREKAPAPLASVPLEPLR